VINQLFSSNFVTAKDNWNEFSCLSPGKPALTVLEETYGNSWGSDPKFKQLEVSEKALQSAWSLQKPIYNLIVFLKGTHQNNVAIAMIQEVPDLFHLKHSKKPNFVNCKKEFVLCWGPLPSMPPHSSNTTLPRLSNLTESETPPPPPTTAIDNSSGS
jgi:hypothetical protein